MLLRMLMWLEIICRWLLGLQFLFWGLNGFFHWRAVPPSADFIQRFADLCGESKFIMPTVKVFEIIFGALLLSGYSTILALIFLGPIVFVITGLHLLHNRKWWEIILPISAPYLLILLFQEERLLVLLH
jgi:uncharacterized membrane protein YphA (DoxX/SURF4 family)